MKHRSLVGRHDLLTCVRAMPDAPLELLAALCGFAREEERVPVPEAPRVAPKPEPEVSAPRLAPKAKVRPRAFFLMPIKARSWDAAKPERGEPGKLRCEVILERNNGITERELSVKEDVPLPPPPPLQPWARLWPFLRRALGRLRESNRVDARRLVRHLAARRPITHLPCLQYPAWAERVQIVFDRRLDLAPFWDESQALIKQVSRHHGGEGIEVVRLDAGQAPSALPSAGVPVLVLSDCGQLPADEGLTESWRQYGLRLRRARLGRVALLPCPRDRWDDALARLWTCVCWDRAQRLPGGRRGLRPLPGGTEAERGARVERLLTLLAPALRVEPGLLRAARLLLGGQADVGAEYDAWHHPRAVNDGVSAMGLRAAHAVARRERHRAEIPVETKSAFAKLLRVWHADCAETIRAAETLGLVECGAPVPEAEVETARSALNRAAAALLKLAREGDLGRATALEQGLVGLHRRALARAAPAEREVEEFLAVGWVILRWWNEKKVVPVPPEFDPELLARVQRLLEADPGHETLWEVRQLGEELLFRPAGRSGPGRAFLEPTEPPLLAAGLPLALLRARRSQLNLSVTDLSGKTVTHSFLTRSARDLRFRIGRPRHVRLATDCGNLELDAVNRPPWAQHWGQDQFGLFAEFELKAVRFRLRWIPPGSFLMGSPDNERGRYSDEGSRHLVTITTGFWMSEAPCTQEQWQAVTGWNPSEFKGARRPVESVTWHECQEFCTALGSQVPPLPFRLPTEAEWEYACRAGTDSAFNDGSACTKPEGKDPALDKLGWFDKNSGGETHPVGEKAPNAWGLYDMHGNVWEWCADCADWKDGVVTDTYVNGVVDPLCTRGAWRVVRGGAYWDGAWRCRSAYRFAGGPGIRIWSQGFRLVAGQELESGARGEPGKARAATGREAGGAERRPEAPRRPA